MMDQVTYLHWSVGQPQYYRPCYSVFACGGPYATTIGAEPIVEHPSLALLATDAVTVRAATTARHRSHRFHPTIAHPAAPYENSDTGATGDFVIDL
jgi:hypothetical protein